VMNIRARVLVGVLILPCNNYFLEATLSRLNPAGDTIECLIISGGKTIKTDGGYRILRNWVPLWLPAGNEYRVRLGGENRGRRKPPPVIMPDYQAHTVSGRIIVLAGRKATQIPRVSHHTISVGSNYAIAITGVLSVA